MSKRSLDQAKVDEAFGLRDLGVIDEPELERRIEMAGVSTTRVAEHIEDAPDHVLAALFAAPGVTEALRAFIASLIVGRGLDCRLTCAVFGIERKTVEAYAKKNRIERSKK